MLLHGKSRVYGTKIFHLYLEHTYQFAPVTISAAQFAWTCILMLALRKRVPRKNVSTIETSQSHLYHISTHDHVMMGEQLSSGRTRFFC